MLTSKPTIPMWSNNGLQLNSVYIQQQKKSQALYSPMTEISGLTKNVVMQLKWVTPYESACCNERREPQLKNIKMLEETQNKYVWERRRSFKKTFYMIWKINLDMRVENVLKSSVSSRWEFNQDLTYVKTALGILSLVNSKCYTCGLNNLKAS
jgi:hypothetical protein